MNNHETLQKQEVLEYQTKLNDDENRRRLTAGRELRRIEDIIHLKHFFPDSKSVLCIGARDDSEIQTFIDAGYEAKGIDICRETNLITKMDMADLTTKFGTFDIAYCSHVLEHVIDPLKVFKAIKRVTKKAIFIILPIVNRQPDIEHPTVYEVMKHQPSKNFIRYPQAWDDFHSLMPWKIKYCCYRNALTEDYEVAFILELGGWIN